MKKKRCAGVRADFMGAHGGSDDDDSEYASDSGSDTSDSESSGATSELPSGGSGSDGGSLDGAPPLHSDR